MKQTTDNTPAIMKAAEKAHQSRYSARQTAPLTFAIWDNVKNAPIIETTSNGIMAYMEIFGIDRIDTDTAETTDTENAENTTTTTTSTEYHTPAYNQTTGANQNAEDAPQTAEQINGAFTPRAA